MPNASPNFANPSFKVSYMEKLVHNVFIFNETVFVILVSLVYYYSLYYYFELVFIFGFNFR